MSANRYIDRPHWIGKNMKIFVFHKRVTSAEEDLIIKNLPIQHFLSPALLSLPNGLMNIVAMVSGMEVRHGLRNIKFHSPMLIWLWPCMKAQPASSRDQHWALDMVPCPSDPGTKPASSALQAESLPLNHWGSPWGNLFHCKRNVAVGPWRRNFLIYPCLLLSWCSWIDGTMKIALWRLSYSGSWKAKGKSLSHVWLFPTPWTAAYQAPPSMGFSRQEYWSGVPAVRWPWFARLGPPEDYIYSESVSNIGAVSPIVRIHRSRD